MALTRRSSWASIPRNKNCLQAFCARGSSDQRAATLASLKLGICFYAAGHSARERCDHVHGLDLAGHRGAGRSYDAMGHVRKRSCAMLADRPYQDKDQDDHENGPQHVNTPCKY
jgi:hypothetical protein